HRALTSLRAQIVFEKTPHLAVALTDQRNDADVRGAVARHTAQQRTFPDTAAAEDPDPLSFAAREHSVDRPVAGRQQFRDMFALHGTGRGSIQVVKLCGRDLPAPVHRTSETVEYPAQELRANLHAGLLAARHHAVAGLQAVDLLERHREHISVAKP